MKIVAVEEGGAGIAELDGSRQQVDLSLIAAPRPGDYIIVHAGFAIERLDETEANARLDLFSELAETQAAVASAS